MKVWLWSSDETLKSGFQLKEDGQFVFIPPSDDEYDYLILEFQ